MKRISQDCQSGLPDNSAVKQQQLPAYQLQLSANKILSGFFATGVFCLGVGVILLLSAKTIKEVETFLMTPQHSEEKAEATSSTSQPALGAWDERFLERKGNAQPHDSAWDVSCAGRPSLEFVTEHPILKALLPPRTRLIVIS
ncbi:hypothetical protein J1605_000299 [Eschrichtius robustus]|uniref:Uncharacterized protein n=1 Tax=Eschrichtius robustus TaxID=9764 RepID=A0AB34HPB5_ESCRO|nr:hypothetical protein J1605_000299 [Eschrichtius robustus]